MDDKRKELYRELLYWAMVDMRLHSGNAVSTMRGLLSQRQRSYRSVNHFIHAMNNWLHNTALYSSIGFDGFKEALFWQDYQQFRQRFPADRWAALTETIIKKLKEAEPVAS